MISRYLGCLLGLAIGDALGAPVEFKSRGTFRIFDYEAGGVHNVKKGEWTDDTSMALCLAASLCDNDFDLNDQLSHYIRWWRSGYMCTRSECFDIGNQTADALLKYTNSGYNTPLTTLTDNRFSGNGSIMRLAPVCMYFGNKINDCLSYAELSSKTTHGSKLCTESCKILAHVIFSLLNGSGKYESLFNIPETLVESAPLKAIIRGDYHSKTDDEIIGSGFVVESLEAALYCFYSTNTFEDAVLKAVNLGDDTDTTAAICGQMAGAYYGIENIPEKWVEGLMMSEMITTMAVKLFFKRRRYDEM